MTEPITDSARPQIFVDGQAAATVDAADRGLAYGDGLFETCRVIAGTLPLWSWHSQRLIHGLSEIKIPFEVNGLQGKVNVALQATAGRSGTLKLIVTRGSGGRGYAPPEAPSSRVITLFYSDTEDPFASLASPARLWLCRTRLGENPALAGLKHLARLENVLARSEWQTPHYDEGLLLDYSGRVIEATAHNLFVVLDGVLLTPALNTAGVAGVMRQLIMTQLAPAFGWSVQETTLSLTELARAEEVFLCNSNRGVRPVSSLEDGQRQWGRWQSTAYATALQVQLQQYIQAALRGES